MDRGAWQATVYGVGLSTHTRIPIHQIIGVLPSQPGRHTVDTERNVRTPEGSTPPGQTWTTLALAPDSGSL